MRLVEAVKLVDTTGVSSDGRIWPAGRGIDLGVPSEAEATSPSNEGRALLKHAARSQDGYYVVESPPSGRLKK